MFRTAPVIRGPVRHPRTEVIGTKTAIAVELLAKKKPNDRHCYAYDVLVGGEAIVSNSRDPEHDLARAMVARDIKGVVEVIDGRTRKPRSRVNVGAAATRGIGSNLDRYNWKPHEIGKDSPLADDTEPLGIQRRGAA